MTRLDGARRTQSFAKSERNSWILQKLPINLNATSYISVRPSYRLRYIFKRQWSKTFLANEHDGRRTAESFMTGFPNLFVPCTLFLPCDATNIPPGKPRRTIRQADSSFLMPKILVKMDRSYPNGGTLYKWGGKIFLLLINKLTRYVL